MGLGFPHGLDARPIPELKLGLTFSAAQHKLPGRGEGEEREVVRAHLLPGLTTVRKRCQFPLTLTKVLRCFPAGNYISQKAERHVSLTERDWNPSQLTLDSCSLKRVFLLLRMY